MYKITFSNIGDIRMGSPYNIADINVEDGYFPEVRSEDSFQDKCAITADGETCFVVQWDTQENEPGFRIWKVSNLEKTVKKSERIAGCCAEISILPDSKGVQVEAWEHQIGNRVEMVTHFK